MRPLALEPVAPDVVRARIAALEQEIRQRDDELSALKTELHALQTRYLKDIGPLYAQLARTEAAVVEAEIARGLRTPPADDELDPAPADPPPRIGCSNHGAPSDDLKRMFRQLARTIHPDLALNDPARYRRHSLMAEANRAYAERDADRLRLILHAWHAEPDASAIDGDDPDATRARAGRRLAALEAQQAAMDAELADLRSSAIFRLKTRIDAARAQGWDLFAEMRREVEREVRRAAARLAALSRP